MTVRRLEILMAGSRVVMAIDSTDVLDRQGKICSVDCY
jgi:hypothetical protein